VNCSQDMTTKWTVSNERQDCGQSGNKTAWALLMLVLRYSDDPNHRIQQD